MKNPDFSIWHLSPDDWSDEVWEKAPIETVAIQDLVPTQDAVYFPQLSYLLNGGEHDEIGRAIRMNNILYLYDGHHRWTISLLSGKKLFTVRTITVDVG